MNVSAISPIAYNKIGVRFSGRSLTYDEINERIKNGQIEQIKALLDL